MAKQSSNSTSSQETEIFNKGLIKDYDDIFYPEGTWSHPRNATNNTVGGDVGIIGNEPANGLCTVAPYTVIGQINVTGDKWVIFSTDNTDSEIGLFIESDCSYHTIANAPCLNFNLANLITGASKENFDCSYQIYFVDGVNPDRTMNIGDIRLGNYNQPWLNVPYVCADVNPDPSCTDCQPVFPYQLDCEKLRMTKITTIPCVSISKGAAGGTLANGSYFATVAYTVNQQRVTDYLALSPVQALFDHDNLSGSLEITVDNLDPRNFDEFQLVIVRTVNQQTSAKSIGYYSTKGTQTIYLDYINESLPSVPIEFIPLRTPSFEKSDAMYVNGSYLLKTGPSSKFDFNYQPLANNITSEWVMTEEKPDYYKNGGNKTGYMRDEQYAFWIRWVYNTGERSSSYHIPGRKLEVGIELENDGITLKPSPAVGTQDDVELAQYNDQGGNYIAPKIWEAINTAYITSNIPISPTSPIISGNVVGYGKMGYWESTEVYDDTKPEIWGDLCGKPIRHHKMPADIIHTFNTNGAIGSNISLSRVRTNNNKPIAIRILGVRFNNIAYPVDNYGRPIPNLVGYEILRSSREGNKTIIAKGLLNNMRVYTNAENEKILYQNYPYNYLGADPTITNVSWQDGGNDPSNLQWNLSQNFANEYRKDIFTFHSPDTQFKNPFLSGQELRLYSEVGSNGNVRGNFEEVPGHPKHKLPTNMTFFIATAVGIGIASKSVRGKEVKTIVPAQLLNPGLYQGSAEGSAIGAGGGASLGIGNTTAPIAAALSSIQYQLLSNTIGNTALSAIAIDPALNTMSTIQQLAGILGTITGGTISNGVTTNVEKADLSYTAPSLKTLSGVITYANYINEGTDATIDVILSFNKYRQYATRYISHADMLENKIGNVGIGNSRRYIRESNYINNQLQNFQVSKPAGGFMQSVYDNKTINNIFRGRAVAINLDSDLLNPLNTDNSLQTIYTAKQAGLLPDNREDKNFDEFRTTTHSYYGAIKVRLRNQYGQLGTVRQIPTGCMLQLRETTSLNTNTNSLAVVQSPTIFGGDVYIGRYTEKNTFFYFYDWLMNQPDGTEFDYRLRSMIANPRFWADFTKFDTAEFIGNMIDSVASGNIGASTITGGLPSNRFNLDNDVFANTVPGLVSAFTDPAQAFTQSALAAVTELTPIDEIIALFQNFGLQSILDLFGSIADPVTNGPSVIQNTLDAGASAIDAAQALIPLFQELKDQLKLVKKNNYFYITQSGVRDFFVESEINVDLRDWGNNDAEFYYDPYRNTNLNQLFAMDIIKSGNYFKYDISLSNSRVFTNFISWGNMQARYYDPFVAETCYTYYPNRIIYSLPQQDEAVKDYWQVFLPNNYKDFTSRVTAVKQIAKNGALILFASDSPAQFLGVDTLETDAGTKLTIGDGGLFSQPLQYLSNADGEFQHGSCQNRLTVTNTPAGVYYLSQAQGKVFAVTGKGLEEISSMGMRWWFNKYLPYLLTKDFPNYYLTDNPVVGIGCQSVFDNSNQILYFSKRDFRTRRDITNVVTYAPNLGYNKFLVDGVIEIDLGDPAYFEDCSWTLSYDPKNQMWISFHDWHPELCIPSRNYFFTTKTVNGSCGIWKHNDRTDLYANYYGTNYPFEIEYIASTGQTVDTLRSLEYDLECYTYDADGIDTYHVLDFNFDHAIIHNTEQVSGVLNMNLMPKKNPILSLQYPKINPTSIDVLYSKEEQKYRMNQFWDITRDRGEFTYPNVQQPIWSTELNGYKRQLNFNNLDYQKPAFQRKKFRHYTAHALLYRNVSGPVKMLFKLTNNKNLYSPR